MSNALPQLPDPSQKTWKQNRQDLSLERFSSWRVTTHDGGNWGIKLKCFVSSTATDGKDWRGLKLENVGPTFPSFTAMPTKINKKLLFDIMLSAQNSFDIFVTTLQEQFMYGVKALSYDLSTVT